MDTTEHLTVDQIIDAAYASEVPPGDPDDHDMLMRLAKEVLHLRGDRDWWRARAIKRDPLLELVQVSEEAGLLRRTRRHLSAAGRQPWLGKRIGPPALSVVRQREEAR